MTMTPDEIADRKFLVGLRGYDRDEVRKFLVTVADDYRAVLEKSGGRTNGTSAPAKTEEDSTEAEKPAVSAKPPAPVPEESTDAPVATSSPEDFARMGEEVAAILRTAHEQVASLKRKAQEDADAHKAAVEERAELTKAEAEMYGADLRTKAEKYGADLRTKADTWAESRKSRADAELEEAKRAHAKAQDEALALVADAEKRAQRMLQATERKARTRADEVLSKARTELAELRQSQEQANQWLEAARTYIGQAIGTYRSTGKPDLAEPPELIDDPASGDEAKDAGKGEDQASASGGSGPSSKAATPPAS